MQHNYLGGTRTTRIQRRQTNWPLAPTGETAVGPTPRAYIKFLASAPVINLSEHQSIKSREREQTKKAGTHMIAAIPFGS